MTFPITMYHPDSKNPNKVLHAHTQKELDVLTRLGWKVKV